MNQLDRALPRLHVDALHRRRGRPGTVVRTRLAAVSAWFEHHALFVAALAAIATVDLVKLPEHLGQDGWLALVGGRYVASHGVPSSDTLNVLTHGARWVDQQWLAQLVLYRVERLGGLFLYGALHVFLATAAFGLMIAAARSFGGTERPIAWVLPASGFLYIAGSFAIRTQGLAYPLFVAVLWLLARGAREPTRGRVYAVFPLLVLWANVHGSVTLGVGLAVLFGLALLGEDLRHGGPRAIRRRTIAFVIGPPLCLFATPYGFSIIGYYRETLLNPTFGKAITEWHPVTSAMVFALPCLGLAAATIWILGRTGRRARIFDQLALIGLAGAAVFAIRNITWFALATGMLLPAYLAAVTAERRPACRRRTLNLAIASLAAAILAGSLIAVAARPASWFDSTYDKRTLASVQKVIGQHPDARIFADVRYSDWLLWRDPALAGKLAYDTRFELLTKRQLLAIADLGAMLAPHQLNVLKGFTVLVLERSADYTNALLSRPGTHVVSKNSDAVVAVAADR